MCVCYICSKLFQEEYHPSKSSLHEEWAIGSRPACQAWLAADTPCLVITITAWRVCRWTWSSTCHTGSSSASPCIATAMPTPLVLNQCTVPHCLSKLDMALQQYEVWKYKREPCISIKKDRVKLSQHSHSSTGQPQDQEPKSLTPIAKSNNKLLKKSQPHPQQEY